MRRLMLMIGMVRVLDNLMAVWCRNLTGFRLFVGYANNIKEALELVDDFCERYQMRTDHKKVFEVRDGKMIIVDVFSHATFFYIRKRV